MSSRFQKVMPARSITRHRRRVGRVGARFDALERQRVEPVTNHRRGGLGRESLVPVRLAEPIEQLEPRRLVKEPEPAESDQCARVLRRDPPQADGRSPSNDARLVSTNDAARSRGMTSSSRRCLRTPGSVRRACSASTSSRVSGRASRNAIPSQSRARRHRHGRRSAKSSRYAPQRADEGVGQRRRRRPVQRFVDADEERVALRRGDEHAARLEALPERGRIRSRAPGAGTDSCPAEPGRS